MTRKELPYADILRAIADGKTIQYKVPIGDWENTSITKFFRDLYYGRDLDRYRVKPPTILINGREVPEPLREQPSMALRDYFAAKAMQGMLSNEHCDFSPMTRKAQNQVAFDSYAMADAMLAASEATGQEGAL